MILYKLLYLNILFSNLAFVYCWPSIFTTNFIAKIPTKLFDTTVCSFKECCGDVHIPADFDKLEKTLKERVYGQHLVEVAVDALRSHWSPNHKSRKALTLSFHGWPGGGKNYVTGFIIDSLFAKGIKSKFVHYFVGRIHFPREDHVENYQNDLYNWIKGNMSVCDKQIFIFDEVDKMPPQLLNKITPLIDYKDMVDGIDYTNTIFIFLSNTGQNVINDYYLTKWNEGVKREDLKLSDFENLITKGIFNEKGGFHFSDTIKSNLIDHYIPFLPMELKHVNLCIFDEFKQRGILYPSKEDLDEVLSSIEWGPPDAKIFSKTGCKRISQKVGLLASKNYRHINKEL